MVNKLADAEEVVGPLNDLFVYFYFSFFFGPEQSWTEERGTYCTCPAFAFIDLKKKKNNCYGDNQHPSLPVQSRNRQTHRYTFTSPSCSRIASVYNICRDDVGVG